MKATTVTPTAASEGVRVLAATHPLKVGRVDVVVPEGRTIAEIFEALQPDPILRKAAHVYLGEHYVPRERWRVVRPRAGTSLSIRAFIPVTGGGGGGGGAKSILRIVLMVAVVALAFAAPLALPAIGLTAATPVLGGLITAGQLATAVVGFAGMLLINAIAPPRPPQLAQLSGTGAGGERSSPTLFIEGARNRARPFEVVPVVLGRHRMVPPYGARPYTEIVGGQNYLRLLFVWGVGPLTLSDFKIGETLLSEFDGVEVEHREGYEDDDPLTLYPNSVDQQDYTILLEQTTDWVTRTTTPNADEISIDLTFPRGLVGFASGNGARVPMQVTVQIQYAVTGTSNWQPIPTAGGVRTFPDSWIDDLGTDESVFSQVTFDHQQDSAIRHGITWVVPTRGQYDIRVRRLTVDRDDSDQIVDQIMWTAVRRFTNEDPLNSPVPLAKTALRIKATDQLNQIVDEFNGIVESVCLDHDITTPGDWVLRETRNPASLFRHVLQGNALQEPLADSRLDLDNLEEFHTWCSDKGYTFDMVRDFQSSLWDTLSDVAAAGRGSPAQIDGKWGVIIDRPQATPVSHITPRNSWEFSAAKMFADKPHAFRIRFPNEDQGYRQDERIVYLTGYSAANATKFETIELPGVVDPDLIWKHGSFHAAAAELRPERWTFKQQLEHLVYRRGDRVLITHDVLLVGLASGRIKALELDTSGDVAGVTVDEALPMTSAGTSYGMSIRTATNAQVTAQVVTVVGEQTQVTFTTPIPAASAPAVGDLFGFGELGSETDDALILSIEPEEDHRASIQAIPYRAAVYTADSGSIPPFTTNLTPLTTIPAPVILGLRSDESVLVLGPGESLQARVAIEVKSLADTSGINDLTGQLDAQMRLAETGEPFVPAIVERVTPTEVLVSGVRTGETWDFRLRWRIEGRLPGPWATSFNHRVVGRSSDPSALSGLTISAFGGQAMMRWNRPPELDVVFGGEVRFRHSPLFAGAAWEESASIGEVARARDLVASLPLKPGTYLARVYDVDGNASTIVTVTTKQASVLTFAAADALDEGPAFAGAHENTAVADGSLRIAALGTIDDVSDIDSLSDIDSIGGIASLGTYYFQNGFDFGAVTKVRLTTRVGILIVNTLDNFDERTGNIDDWASFDGTAAAAGDCKVYVRHTDDNPDLSGASWSAWERLDSAEFEARGFEFLAVLSTEDESYNVFVDELGIDAEELAP